MSVIPPITTEVVSYITRASLVLRSRIVFAVVSSNGQYQDVYYRAFARECPFDV